MSEHSPAASQSTEVFKAKEGLNIFNISDNFEAFRKHTENNFEDLKRFLKKEFTQRINKLEEKIDLTPAYLDELLNLKHCLLEVQQKFFDLKHVHRNVFLADLERMILLLVKRVMHLETQVKNSISDFREKIEESDARIYTPKYESLLAAKKVTLSKLISAVTPKFQAKELVITLDPAKIKKFQEKHFIKITPEIIRNALFLIIPAPIRIEGPRTCLESKLYFCTEEDTKRSLRIL